MTLEAAALRKIAPRRRRRVPYIQQLHASDCGAACLAMALGYHGRQVRLDDLRQEMQIGRDGTNARAMAAAAERHGMRSRGLRVEPEGLRYLPTGTILHWAFNHFVVFERVTRRGVQIVDPAHGRRLVPHDRFREEMTGVALVLEPTEEFQPLRANGKRVWVYLRKLLGQRPILVRVLATSIILRIFALAVPLLTGLIVDRVLPRADLNLLAVVAAGMGAMLLFQFASTMIRAHLLLELRTHLDTKMTLGFVDHLVTLPYSFFQRRSAGDIMLRVNSNATIREILTSTTLSALLDGVLVLVYLVILLLLSPTMTLIVAGIGLLQILVFLLSRRRQRELMTEGLETQARSQGYLVELVGGIESLKVAGAERDAVTKWSNLFVDEINVGLARGRLDALVGSVMSTIGTASPMLILGVGAVLVVGGDISLGTMLAINALAAGFLAPLGALVGSALKLQLLGSYIERIDDVLDTEPEQRRDTQRLRPELTGAIALDQVSFAYNSDSPPVVDDVSLTIEPGSTVAIVGESGSGKSTLAGLMLGLYEPNSGQVLYDGQPLGRLDLRATRRQLGVVSQHPHIFGTSVRDNISLGDPGAPLARVIEAARRACIHDDIMAMPMGYETVIADGGASLSGGQRQRIALARALLKSPGILLLDEATSSLDTVIEDRVMRELDRLRCTRIIIAHRLSTIANADTIVVMDRGSIVESGTHRELVGRDGPYRRLIAAQHATSALAPRAA